MALLNFSNFVLRFGDAHVMGDYLEEIVIPAFFDEGLVREYDGGRVRYFLNDVKLVNFGGRRNPELAITGYFVRDKPLERTHIFTGSRLIPDHDELPSAAFLHFALVLRTHKLAYRAETPYAPPLSSLSSTLNYFLKERRKKYIKELKQEYPRRKVAELAKTVAVPALNLIPLVNPEDIASFIEQYAILQSIEIRLPPTNQEGDYEPLFARLRASGEAVSAKITAVNYRNNDG